MTKTELLQYFSEYKTHPDYMKHTCCTFKQWHECRFEAMYCNKGTVCCTSENTVTFCFRLLNLQKVLNC